MKIRLLLFRHAWWLGFIGIAIAWAVLLAMPITDKEPLLATVTGLGLGFCYFAQRQHLDELRLFKELFIEFNNRYDRLNNDLLDIRDGRMIDNDGKSRKVLIDYFNLCAEEYLFFREGHIHDDVWQSWCRGMLYFVEHENIRTIWDSEADQRSYYGLTIEVMRHGAR